MSTLTCDGETQTNPVEDFSTEQLQLPQVVMDTLAEARDNVLALQNSNKV